MTTTNVSLAAELRSYVDEQVVGGRYGSTSEYVRELIRRDQDRQRLRALLTSGATSELGPVADDHYFQRLRDRVCWPLTRSPYLVLYVEHSDHVDVWSVLHTGRDIPPTLADIDDE